MRPNHIAFIPDGNRRWSEQNNLSKKEGYLIGIRHIGNVLKWCREAEVKIVSMWGFSTDNFKRDKEEVAALFELFREHLLEGLSRKKEAEDQGKEVKVRFFGRLNLLPKEIQRLIYEVETATKNNGPYQLNLLLAYGGREELVDAVNDLLSKGVESVDLDSFRNFLYTQDLPDPDLIIRTAGEKRLSGFMPWQSAYSELYFSNKLWPDFSYEDFQEALSDYARRKRKFGK